MHHPQHISISEEMGESCKLMKEFQFSEALCTDCSKRKNYLFILKNLWTKYLYFSFPFWLLEVFMFGIILIYLWWILLWLLLVACSLNTAVCLAIGKVQRIVQILFCTSKQKVLKQNRGGCQISPILYCSFVVFL